MRVSEVQQDQLYIGKNGTFRYIDEINDLVEYYEMLRGDGDVAMGYCLPKTFARWAVRVASEKELDPTDNLRRLLAL